MYSSKSLGVGRFKKWFWTFVHFSLYAFAVDVVVDVFNYDPGLGSALSSEEIAAPLLALCAATLGLAATASSNRELKERAHGVALWSIAIVSAYFWVASLALPDRSLPHPQLLAALLWVFAPSAVTGLAITICSQFALWRFEENAQEP